MSNGYNKLNGNMVFFCFRFVCKSCKLYTVFSSDIYANVEIGEEFADYR